MNNIIGLKSLICCGCAVLLSAGTIGCVSPQYHAAAIEQLRMEKWQIEYGYYIQEDQLNLALAENEYLRKRLAKSSDQGNRQSGDTDNPAPSRPYPLEDAPAFQPKEAPPQPEGKLITPLDPPQAQRKMPRAVPILRSETTAPPIRNQHVPEEQPPRETEMPFYPPDSPAPELYDSFERNFDEKPVQVDNPMIWTP